MRVSDIHIREYPVKFVYDKRGNRIYTSGSLLRDYLIFHYGICHWCGCKVQNYGRRNWQKGDVIPDDFGTIDHIDSRFLRDKHEVTGKVLACYKDNQKRSVEEVRLFRSQ